MGEEPQKPFDGTKILIGCLLISFIIILLPCVLGSLFFVLHKLL